MGTLSAGLEHRKLALWALLFLIANIGVKASYAGSMLLLATLLAPSEYASYGLLYALQSGATTLAVIGLIEVTAGRLRNYGAETRHKLFQDITGLFVYTALVSCIFLLPIMFWLGGREGGLAVIPATLLGIITGFSVMQASFDRIDERHAVSLLTSAGIPLAAIVGVLFGTVLFGNLVAIYSLGLLGAAGVMLALGLSGKFYRITLPDRSALRSASLEIVPFVAIGVLGWASGYGMTLVVDTQFDPLAVAGFTFIYTAASVSQMVANSLNMVWAPRFYRLYNGGNHERAERQSGQFFAAMALVLGITGFVVAVALPWVTWFVGGNLARYGLLHLELALLLSGYVLSTALWHCQNYFLVSGRGKEMMINSLWSGPVSLVLWVICMLILGPLGAYVGFLLQIAIKAVLLWAAARQHWTVRPWWPAIILCAALPFAALLVPVP
ncbi:MAG: hypothetical protein KME20_00930 [Kaiparowitsia implicata GSE-PSE-MK54-09C]|jgi:O-antigen/teichoic acid export membrane protein|nr:hypothetical protein [Kaiparowitsia implicata GSE-PSE-MK54-09C]